MSADDRLFDLYRGPFEDLPPRAFDLDDADEDEPPELAEAASVRPAGTIKS